MSEHRKGVLRRKSKVTPRDSWRTSVPSKIVRELLSNGLLDRNGS